MRISDWSSDVCSSDLEYLAVLDDAAFGAASQAVPPRISPSDPASRYTSAHGGRAEFCYATNYLIDVAHAVIVDVEASTAVRQAEVTAAKRSEEHTSELQSLMRISYAVFCLKKKTKKKNLKN